MCGTRSRGTITRSRDRHIMPTGPAQDPRKPGDGVPAGTPGSGENVCSRCHGSGAVDGTRCSECAGTGVVTTNVGDA
jgi:hypothetical protein